MVDLTEDDTLVGSRTDSGAVGQAKSLKRGAAVGRYVILDTLGAGGMGIVYAAYDPELDRKVALKLLRGASEDAARGTEGRQRLHREAKAMAKLSHPNVIAVHDVGTHEGRVYVAMEFVDGGTLGAWLAKRDRSWKEILATFLQAGRGLAAAHARELVHRDFKPDNVMLGSDGRARVLDFGLVRPTGAPPEVSDGLVSPTVDTTTSELTVAGAVMGTPAYMAPEQHCGAEAGPAADQFSFCVSLWEALFQERPFAGESLAELVTNVTEGNIREPSHSGPPRWLRRVLERGLSVGASGRWPSMVALLSALEGGHARTRRLQVLAALGLVAACGIATFGLQRRDRALRLAACDDEGATVDTFWNDETRASVRRGLLDSGAGHAEQTAGKLLPRLDAVAERWRAATTQACTRATVEASFTAEQLARARWCLQGRRDRLEALVGRLREASVEGVSNAVGAAANLPLASECVDDDVLTHRPAPPPGVRDEVASVRAALSRAVALRTVAAYGEGLEVAQSALERAQRIGWPTLTAQAGLAVGELLHKTGKSKDAETHLESAFFEAEPAGASNTALRAAVELVFVVGVGQARHGDGLRWSKLAGLMLRRTSDLRGLRRASLLNSIAAIRGAMGEYDEALKLHREALELRQAALDADDPMVAQTLNNMAINHQEEGEYDAAMRLHKRALAIRERGQGPDHPVVAQTLSNLAIVERQSGQLDEALKHNTRALTIRRNALGAMHPLVAASLNNLAVLYKDLKRYGEAHPLYEESLAINESVWGAEHPSVATCLNNLAALNALTGNVDEARRQYTRSVVIFDRAFPNGHVLAAHPLLGLVKIAPDDGPVDDALAWAERALALREANPVAPLLLARARFAVATQLERAEPGSARARELGDKALAAYRAIGGTDATEAAEEVAQWRAALPDRDAVAAPPSDSQ